MRYDPASGFPRVVPELRYRDPAAAVDWLCRKFGFFEILRATGTDGRLSHSELELEGGLVMIARGPDTLPLSQFPNGYSVQIVIFVQDVDEHFRRSDAHGVRILTAPQDNPWGLRQYIALDLEGHGWQFSQHVNDVPPSSWGAVLMK